MENKDTSNGTYWFENIFQKFEDLYNDVDQLVTQFSDFSTDAVMQAESQLVTVGTTVNNFFQELDKVEEALPKSSEAKKAGSASDTSVVQKTDDEVGLKSLLGSNVDSVELVKSAASGLSAEQIGDSTEEKFLLQTPDKIVSSDAGQEIGSDINAKWLIPPSDYVGDLISFTETDDKIVSSNATQEVGLDIEAKLLIPFDDVGDLISFTETDDKIVSSNASQEVGLDIEAKLLIPFDDVGDLISFTATDDRSTNALDALEELRTLLTGLQQNGSDSGFNIKIRALNDIGSTNLLDMSSKNPDKAQLLANALEVDDHYKQSTAAKLPTSEPEHDKLELYDGSDREESEATMHFPASEEQDNYVTDSGLQTKRPLINMELGESCIVVDCAEQESSSGEAANGRSYKKKLKDVFASKMRLLKKCSNDQPESNTIATVALPEKSNSPDYESSESDWEIV